jgi:hypothetical protein
MGRLAGARNSANFKLLNFITNGRRNIGSVQGKIQGEISPKSLTINMGDICYSVNTGDEEVLSNLVGNFSARNGVRVRGVNKTNRTFVKDENKKNNVLLTPQYSNTWFSYPHPVGISETQATPDETPSSAKIKIWSHGNVTNARNIGSSKFKKFDRFYIGYSVRAGKKQFSNNRDSKIKTFKFVKKTSYNYFWRELRDVLTEQDALKRNNIFHFTLEPGNNSQTKKHRKRHVKKILRFHHDLQRVWNHRFGTILGTSIDEKPIEPGEKVNMFLNQQVQ